MLLPLLQDFDSLSEFLINILAALLSPSEDALPVQPKFAAEVGTLSGISYEQPIGSYVTAVGKLGISPSNEGNPWQYAGLQPAAEIALRWYTYGVKPGRHNTGGYLSLRSFWTWQQAALFDSESSSRNYVASTNVSLCWGYNWTLSSHWSLKTQIGLGFYTHHFQQRQHKDADPTVYNYDNGTFVPLDLGLTYRF